MIQPWLTLLMATIGIYDGSQTNNVIGSAELAGATTATLSCRVQTLLEANRTWKTLAICGDTLKPGWLRLSYNVRREGRLWGTFGGVRIHSEPRVLDDGKLHHLAFEVTPGREMKLFVDGVEVAAAVAPAEAIAGGPISVAQRVVVGSADDAWYYQTGIAQHFRGRIIDVAATRGGFDPRRVAGGVEPRAMELELPPNPLEQPAYWKRPQTTRRYLQGPFSERLLVYFREGKVLFGDNEHRDDWSVEYRQLVSHAAWLVHGEQSRPFDFRTARLSLSEGGEPDCAQTWECERLRVRLAACAPWGRKPSAHLRLQVTNSDDCERTEPFGFLLRCAKEQDLVMGAPDIYESYLPRIEDWQRLSAANWRREGSTMRCGDRFVRVKGTDFDWDADAGEMRFLLSLKPGEDKSVELELGRGDSDGLDFAHAHQSMVENWTKELAKLKLPPGFELDPAKRKLIRHLTTQMLQCFAHPVGADYVLPRQGGLQRYVWPGDAISFLGAMDELGYGEYVARAIDFYFEHCLRPSGEAGPFKNRWACDTGCVLKTFAKHVLDTGDRECWRKYRNSAFRAFDWIESMRRAGGGLFPSMKSTDHGASSRHWGFTDMYNLIGITDLAQLAERMRDPRAVEVREAVKSYRAAINRVLDGWKAKSAGSDELYIPLTAEGEVDDGLIEDYMFLTYFGTFAELEFLSEADMHRVHTWMLRRKYADANGLYSNQVSRRGQVRDEHIWYTTWQDQHWFDAWLRVGRRDLAELTLNANLKFALTDEYLVGERYHDYDPWYYPWSPNASGSGRIVQMLLKMHASAVTSTVAEPTAAEVYDLVVAGGTLAAVRQAVSAAKSGQKVFLAAPRPHLGEDRACTLLLERLPSDNPDDPLIREIFNPDYHAEVAYNTFNPQGWRAVDKFAPYAREVSPTNFSRWGQSPERWGQSPKLASVTTPFLVKRACDRALIAAKVEYLTGAQVLGQVSGDSPQTSGDSPQTSQTSGDRPHLSEVRIGFRGGERTIYARKFIDCRMPQRLGKGHERCSFRYVIGPKVRVDKIDFEYDVPYAGSRGYEAVQNYARTLLPASKDLLDVAEMVIPLGSVPNGSLGTDPKKIQFDVVVAGGGTGGAPAALAAARSGEKVLLIEYQHVLGGVSTEGRIGGYGSYYDGNQTGFTKEMDRGTKAIGGAYFWAESEYYRREIVNNGGEVWLGARADGLIVDEVVGPVPREVVGPVPRRSVTGMRVVMPDGTVESVACKVVVDATGNCDLAAAAGCATEFLNADDLSLQGAGMAGQPLGVGCVNSDIGFVDDTDAEDLCAFALRSRLSLPDRIWNQSSLVDSRERRRLRGEFRITPLDLVLKRTYPDTICIAESSFDTHGQTTHPLFFFTGTGRKGEKIRGNIPYRALLPREVDGLIVTGLGISAHRDAMPVLRMKADIRNQGYAAGLAAATAARQDISPRQIDLRELQRKLVDIGNLPERVLTEKDNLPLADAELAEAAKRLENDFDGLAEILTAPDRALPMLKNRNSPNALKVRAMLGDFAAAPAIVKLLGEVRWDAGWNFRGMGQYHRSVSELDATVIALGNTGNEVIRPTLEALSRQLTGESELSHFRALAYAYERLGGRASAAALQALLQLPGVAGHALAAGCLPPIAGYSDQVANAERSDVLRELCLARALYRVGDPDGSAERILCAYWKDPRRVYANYARKVLMPDPANLKMRRLP